MRGHFSLIRTIESGLQTLCASLCQGKCPLPLSPHPWEFGSMVALFQTGKEKRENIQTQGCFLWFFNYSIIIKHSLPTTSELSLLCLVGVQVADLCRVVSRKASSSSSVTPLCLRHFPPTYTPSLLILNIFHGLLLLKYSRT